MNYLCGKSEFEMSCFQLPIRIERGYFGFLESTIFKMMVKDVFGFSTILEFFKKKSRGILFLDYQRRFVVSFNYVDLRRTM